jgi:hypothetical protein
MQFTIDTSGIAALRAKIAEARAALPGLLQQAVQQAGQDVADELSNNAPKGASEGGTPPQGDAAGALAESFYVQPETPPSATGAAISVRTTQPQKLAWVMFGTGIYGPRGQRIVPTTKKALFWPGAQHPVRSVRGMKPNDFVTPVIEQAATESDVLNSVVDQLVTILEG